MIKFSVIIPLYNCEKYITNAIESVLSQSYQGFELIVINDGSTDNSLSILSNYSDNPKMRIINQENEGLFNTRFIGITEAKNDYIVFLDSDDTLENNTLETLCKTIESTQADLIMYGIRRVWKDEKKETMECPFRGEQFISKNEVLLRLYSDNSINNAVTKAFRREIMPIIEMPYFPRVTLGEDGLFSLMLINGANSIFSISDVLYNYYMIDGSMSRAFDTNAYDSNCIITQYYIEQAKNNKNSDELINAAIQKYFKKISSIVLYGKYSIKDKKTEYFSELRKISNDKFFVVNYEKTINRQSIFVKFPLVLLKKKRFKLLYFFKTILSPVLSRR